MKEPFTCDVVYSYFRPLVGAAVDCFSIGGERPSISRPQALKLVPVEESEDFSAARTSRGFVKSGSNDVVKIRLTDSMGRPLAGYHVGVDIYSDPSHDANSGLSVKCADGCIANNEGYIYFSYDVASIGRPAQRGIDDYLNGGDNTDTCTQTQTTARCEP